MDKIIIKDTYNDCLSYALDLYNYYARLVLKYNLKRNDILMNKRITVETRNKKINNVDSMIAFYKEKENNVEAFIQDVKSNKIKDIKFI